MSVFARLRSIDENHKTSVVRRLMEYSTPDFDYFFLVGMSVLMATFGLLLNNASIIIGSMLIAPLMYPILGVSLGLTMSNYGVLTRSINTLVKSLGSALALSAAGAFLLGNETMYHTAEVLTRTEPTIIHFLVAIVAGAAVAYVMARPEWSEAIPGVAISVALIPPLATVGIGLAAFDAVIIKGASLILLLNIIGIIGTAMVIFLLMNLSDSAKQKVAESTIKKEEEKNAIEEEQIKKLDEDLKSSTAV